MNHEFIELLGTPGMKLDGYAIAVLNGTQKRIVSVWKYSANLRIRLLKSMNFSAWMVLISAETAFWCFDEVHDVYFILIYIGFRRYVPILILGLRATVWNGGLDVPGNIKDNGSTTFLLIRNRPGRTQADPC